MRAMTLLFGVVMCLGVSCRTPAPSPPAPLLEYGTPGPDKIRVTIVGDVKEPGMYWVPASSTLASVESVFGGWGGHGDFGGAAPLRVILVRQVNGREVRTKYSLHGRTEQKADVTLENGDRLIYPAVLF
jgi:protein involved in polysaccharide export with SLBB domain